MKELLQKKTTKIGIAVIILVVAISIISISARSAQRQREYDGHVEAAEKYLTDLDYEQAIAEYTLALEIEPNNEEVLNALEQTYLDYAQSLVDAGNYEKAVSVLEEGYAQIGRENLREKIEQMKDQQRQWEEKEQEQAREVFEKIDSVKGNEQHISDERLEASIRWLIPVMESAENYQWLARLYYWIGEYELSSKRFNQFWEMQAADDDKYKTESELFVYSLEGEGIRDERTYNQYGFLINSKEISLIDGSVDEWIYEYDEGKEKRWVYSRKRNGPWEQNMMRSQGNYGEEYCVQGRDCIEYEYDDLGRVTKVVVTQHSVFSNGTVIDNNRIDTYTYYDEKKFTSRSVGERLKDGVKSQDYEYSIDYEIINEYGEFTQVGESYNNVNNYYD